MGLGYLAKRCTLSRLTSASATARNGQTCCYKLEKEIEMIRKSPNMNRCNMVAWTERAKASLAGWLKLANDANYDTRQAERLKRHECIACFYGGRVGGSAMTKQSCMCCGKDELYSSTCTDVLCMPCAEKHSLCKRCGGDLEMRARRRDWPVADKHK